MVSVEEHYVRRCAEELRRDGSVVARLQTPEDATEWRAQMRRACRAAGLRVRTGLTGDGEVAWAYHVDHVITPAASRAASRAIEAAFSADVQPVPFHELVRQEQRKMLRVVPPQAGQG
jgi:hypothetical protein